MFAVRVRTILRKRTRAWCAECERPIAVGDSCFETSWYEPGRVWSEYQCCGKRRNPSRRWSID